MTAPFRQTKIAQIRKKLKGGGEQSLVDSKFLGEALVDGDLIYVDEAEEHVTNGYVGGLSPDQLAVLDTICRNTCRTRTEVLWRIFDDAARDELDGPMKVAAE